ncbi:hypothetical protein [Nocardiopsis sp. FIRDI 009]|uniref:hypothetical protein n=1 Tax=Nocardiopsis sp. FIRDI 009 TaxID=714197 RepID=UPI000E224805|nr:hypothetical protein [Nocardiopsis sp. FIRDI 009]
MNHPPNPDPVPLRQEPYLLPPPPQPRPGGGPHQAPPVRTDRMPLPLRFLRVLCVLNATFTLLLVPYVSSCCWC